MLILMAISSILLLSASPIKTAFFVLVISLLTSVNIFMEMSSTFVSAAVVISFSSGMMILFCYCSNIVNFEKKSLKMKSSNMVVLTLTLLLATGGENTSETTISSAMSMVTQTQFLSMAMAMVVVSMLCVNKMMFNPHKNMMSTY